MVTFYKIKKRLPLSEVMKNTQLKTRKGLSLSGPTYFVPDTRGLKKVNINMLKMFLVK